MLNNPLDFGSFRRLSPVSRRWGFDRGTPIDRYYIESFLKSNSARIRGHVLEVKDRNYTVLFGAENVTESSIVDLNPLNTDATHIADISDSSSFASEEFDCVIFTQTLQLVVDPKLAIKTLHKVLRPGGTLLITCPGITRIQHTHGDGTWYWTFTPSSLELLLEDSFEKGSYCIESKGNVFAATCFLWGLSVEEITTMELDHQDLDFPLVLTVAAIKSG